MDTFYRWYLSSRQESLMQVSEKLFTEQQQWLLYVPVSSVMTDIFWTCIKFQNTEFIFKEGAQLFILAGKCVYIYEMLALSWLWLRGEADASSILTPSVSARTGKSFPTKRPRNAQNISKRHPGLSSLMSFLTFSHRLSLGSQNVYHSASFFIFLCRIRLYKTPKVLNERTA